MKLKVLTIFLTLLIEGAYSFAPQRLVPTTALHERNTVIKGTTRIISNRQKESRREVLLRRNVAFGLPDFPLIPTFLLVTLGVFALFNINNDADLTDAGRAEARRKRRAERIARGEDLTGKSNPFKTDDPYRWRVFEDDTDDDNFEMLNKK